MQVNIAEALRDAATEVTNGDGDAQSLDVRNAVASMLEWMADELASEGFDGKVFGESVADLANGIAGAPDDLPEAADNSDAGDDVDDNGSGPPRMSHPGVR